jgi:hypothetical protein
MNVIELDRAARLDPMSRRHFLGVYARNRLPRCLPFGQCYFIANTDPSNEPGTHWVAFYFNTAKRTAEYFDSYGQSPSAYPTFEGYLRTHARHVSYNFKRIQALDSTACGHYCLYYLYQRSRGKSLSTDAILKRFGANPVRNDQIVYQWYVNRYGHTSRSLPNVLTLVIERQLRRAWS